MDRDSRAAASIVSALGKSGRHAIRLGVPAGDLRILAPAGGDALSRFAAVDRRAGGPAPTQSTPVETEKSQARRAELAASRPTFVVDGLGEYNPHLAVTQFGDLRAWMADYREVGRSGAA